MWTVARFQPTSLFSLRPALTTASGAQSLLVPTPYAIKMALVGAAIQIFGLERGAYWWPSIRDLEIAIALPDAIVVNKTFIKIQRPTRVTKGNAAEVAAVMEAGIYPMGPTIAFREFVQFDGEVSLALRNSFDKDVPLGRLLSQINYLGKRGGFWQIQKPADEMVELTSAWTLLTASANSFSIDGTLQMLDDCGSKLSWEHANVYTGKSIKLGSDERVLRSVVLPYRLRRSSYRYSLYERLTP
jgi:hypothetical protein